MMQRIHRKELIKKVITQLERQGERKGKANFREKPYLKSLRQKKTVVGGLLRHNCLLPLNIDSRYQIAHG